MWIFIYGFSKNELSNISLANLHNLKNLADDLLNVPLDKLNEVLEAVYEKQNR